MITKEGAKRIAKKEYESMKRPYLSPLQLIFLVLNLIHDILVAKTWYDMSTAIFLTMAIVFTGMSTNEAKELLLKMKQIFQDPKKTLRQKIADVFNVVISGCATLGVLHEEALQYPIEEFVQKVED